MNTEREKKILEILYRRKKITVKELTETLYASEPSIRRDLAHLEQQHLIKRFYGGASIEHNDITNNKIPYLMRELTKHDEKVLIARKAASLVGEDKIIFLDSSSTAACMLPFLEEAKNLTVITNSVKALTDAVNYSFRVISTGGTMNRSGYSLYGEETLQTIRRYYANICFFSCASFDNPGMLSDT